MYAGVIGSKWHSSVLLFAAGSDCIPIVGAAKSLFPNDKRFNHTKVWCTFIYIDLQATGDCVGERFCGRCSDLQLIVYRMLVRLSL